MIKGKLIVFEGVSGTGKETQAKLLQEYLKTKHIISRIVYHPSPELKVILSEWRKTRNIDHVSEAYFLLADRYDRVRQIINPALEKGEWVISLRSYVSALVYQAKNSKDRDYLSKEFLWFESEPDCLFWFDIAPEDAMKRIMERHRNTGETLGKFETPEYLFEKQKAYRQVLTTIDHIRIDAGRSIDEIHEDIIRHAGPIQHPS